jgi:hypothetical protein
LLGRKPTHAAGTYRQRRSQASIATRIILSGCRSGSVSGYHRNRPGAGGSRRDLGRRARAAGWLHAARHRLNNLINATLYPKLSYDFRRDIAPVAAYTA